jgi:hypothetical protein
MWRGGVGMEKGRGGVCQDLIILLLTLLFPHVQLLNAHTKLAQSDFLDQIT